MMITFMTRKQDRISLLRVYKGSDKAKFNEALTEANRYAAAGDLKKQKRQYQTIFTVPFKGSVESTALCFTFSQVRKNPAITIKVVLRKLTKEELWDVCGWLTILFGVGEVWTKFNLSSIEVALDIKLPYCELLHIDTKKRSFCGKLFKDNTLYIGAYKGQKRFRIYDKKKQLAEVKGITLDHESTRLEIVQSGLKLPLNEIKKIPQPFDSLITLKVGKLQMVRTNHPEDSELSSLCNQVNKGVPAHKAYWSLNKSARLRIAQLLKPHALKLQTDDQRWSKWLDEQQLLINELKDIDLDPGSQFTPKFSAINCTEPI